MTEEIADFIRSQSLSVADLDRLIADMPLLRERFSTVSSQTYPSLSDQLEFLSRVVEDQLTGPNCDPTSQTVGEAAFALLYFQRETDLIPDSIRGMGLLDDAMIVRMVLGRHEDAFKRSKHAQKLSWPAPVFDVDQLIAIVSPIRITSFYSSMTTHSRLYLAD
jgi:uncharacterized membrane protein YkvA (DUF1232 family)